ncbi:MAG TPA: IPT/TIG domain-containing protein [Vicinamibacterales bacterium]|nr:IPT/TIG domain-containing protein [Vicinamibacterales bacterium]
MNVSSAPASGNADKPRDTPVEGYGLAALSTYLVGLTILIAFVIWKSIPSCDPEGFIATRLAPAQALSTGGEKLRIFGEGFARDVRVRVGDKIAPAAVISPFEIDVTAPPQPPGRATVTVSQVGFPPVDVPGGLEYVSGGPVVRSIVPLQALTVGDEPLRILGDRFKGDARVKIGALDPVPALFVSPVELVVRTPKHPLGVVDVVVSQGSESSSFPGRLQYVDTRTPATAAPPAAPVQIGAIDPPSAQAWGGEAITITGTGFTSETTVRFGGVPARAVSVDGSRFITAITPMHPPGAVSVMVGNDASVSALDGKFTFVCPAAPDRTMVLIVLLAGALGGLVHALRSLYWYAGEQKLVVNWVPMYLLLPFASAALSFVFYLVIRAGLYQPTAGTNYLLVGVAALVGMFSTQANEKLKAIAEGIFSKAPQGANAAPAADGASKAGAPTISGIKPGSGPLTGGTVVTIMGSGFTPQSVVRFDQTVSSSVTHVNATTLKAVVPQRGSAGTVDVAVKTGDKEVVKEKAYSYTIPKGSITDVNPKIGTPAGGTKITIKGTAFAGDVAVSFGEALGTAPKLLDGSTIEVTSPAQPAGKIDLRVDAGSDLIAVAAGAFEYKA